MKIETQPTDDHQVKIKVEVEPEPLESARRRAARKLAQKVKIPGFRPGKAPYAVIVRHVGEAAVLEEAIEILVDDIYPEVVKEAGIKPFGPGTLENIVQMDPPILEFRIPLQATVELGDYRSVRLDYSAPEITEDRVDLVVASLQDRNAIVEPAERQAQEGDLVRINLSGARKSPADGDAGTLVPERPMSVLIEPEVVSETGAKDESADAPAEAPAAAPEWPYPGFARQLIGLAAGENVTLSHQFPEEYPYESLRGADAEFQVTVEQVNTRSLPALDEEFAKSVGDYENLDALREAIRRDLEEHERAEYNEEFDDLVLEEIIKTSTIKYPPQMLEQEIHNVIHRLESHLDQQKLGLDLYLKTRGIDMDGLHEEAKPVAETRLKKSLVLIEISEVEKITVKPEELETETNRAINALASQMEEKDFRRMLQTEDNRTGLVGNIMMDMLLTRTQERLRLYARGEEVPDPAELAEAPDQEGELVEEPEAGEAAEPESSTADEAEAEASGSAGDTL